MIFSLLHSVVASGSSSSTSSSRLRPEQSRLPRSTQDLPLRGVAGLRLCRVPPVSLRRDLLCLDHTICFSVGICFDGLQQCCLLLRRESLRCDRLRLDLLCPDDAAPASPNLLRRVCLPPPNLFGSEAST
jgi:hypothetical protein